MLGRKDFMSACYSGDLDTVKEYIHQRGGDEIDWNDGLWYASRGGQLPIVQLMIEKGANDWNNQLEIVALMLDRGATELRELKPLSRDKQLQVYNLVTKNEARLLLERHSPAIKERLRMTTIIVLNDRLPEHLIRTIVMEYL